MTARTATYFLANQPTTFDFAVWLSTVRTMGFESVSFIGDEFKDKGEAYTPEIARARMEHILRPLAALAGMPVVEGVGDYHRIVGAGISHMMASLGFLHRTRGDIWRFPYERRHDHITVTIRQSFRNEHRNSNRPEWDKFVAWAENAGFRVVVIEDCEETIAFKGTNVAFDPMPIAERMDAYSCRMNLGVANGPMMLCWLSAAPHLTVGMGKNSPQELAMLAHPKGHDIPIGSQPVWFLPWQRLVWEPDDADTIIREFGEAMERPVVDTEKEGG